MSINYFWFRFFVNYKITLQGKIGGFLRAQKKIFKKGSISVENKESAITYYRGFPVTRFGSYNLSFWLQYRIPNLIGKFGDSTYIDTMQVLLSMYSIPWLATRLYEIIKKMLIERVYVVNRKLSQYDRRSDSRQALIYDVLKVKRYHYMHTTLKPGNLHRFKKIIKTLRSGSTKKTISQPTVISKKKRSSSTLRIRAIRKVLSNVNRLDGLKKALNSKESGVKNFKQTRKAATSAKGYLGGSKRGG